MNRLLILGLLLAGLVALAFRGPQLDIRPMHNDEAVNAIKLRALWEKGEYRYDPVEYHGPTLEYLSFGFLRGINGRDFSGITDAKLRWLTVAFGIGTIFLLPLVADGLGLCAAIYAALLMAVSPAMVFYSRYYIHEMLLVFFTALSLGAGWRYWRTRRLRWAVITGLAVGLMAATKETFVLSIAAAAGAIVLTRLANRVFASPASPDSSRPMPIGHLVASAGSALLVAAVFFSSFFTNWPGVGDAVRTYFVWAHRAGGASPHIHPCFFYFQRLLWFHSGNGPVWSEALVFALACVGGYAAFAGWKQSQGRRVFIRFLAFYTVLLALIYCGIGYKTPWCLLSFWHGAILLAGAGVVALLDRIRGFWVRRVVALALFAGVLQLAFQAWQTAVTYASDPRNPYVYSQTSPDVVNLVDEIRALSQLPDESTATVIKIMSPESEYWPLPWYLRNFKNAGWYDKIPDDPFAPVMIVSTKFRVDLETNRTHVMAGIFELRPQNFFQLYVEKNLWDRHVNSQTTPH